MDDAGILRAAAVDAERGGIERIAELAGRARFVLVGEATHGTHEFYALRAALTRRLIEDYGFDAIAVEGDWPDAYRVNCFVRHQGSDDSAAAALGGFTRWPSWMWRNDDVLEFVTWLRARNERASRRAGFYGLDLYSMHSSVDAVVGYLERVDPAAARRARHRYSCLQRFGDDAQAYGYAVTFGMEEPCEDDVVAQLVELQQRAPELARLDGGVARDEAFHAEQNARLVANAEEYMRAAFRAGGRSWNLRDEHMAETLDALARHLGDGRPAKVVVWAHNSHVGDARATGMAAAGELDLGQLVRERHGDDAFLVGFTTHSGEVTAASDWGGRVERKRVLPALRGSHEALLHDVAIERGALVTGDDGVREVLGATRLERAVGVVYRPETERVSHYFDARMSEQFDAIIHVDHTTAVRPLDATESIREGAAR